MPAHVHVPLRVLDRARRAALAPRREGGRRAQAARIIVVGAGWTRRRAW